MTRSIRFAKTVKRRPSKKRSKTRTLQGQQPPMARSFGYQTEQDIDDWILLFGIPTRQRPILIDTIRGTKRKLSARSFLSQKREDIQSILEDSSVSDTEKAYYISGLLLSG